MAAKLVRWAVRSPGDSVLDPSFGGLVFLGAAHDRLRDLGLKGTTAGEQVFGGELDERAYAKALRDSRLDASTVQLVQGDFLSFSPGTELPVVDAVVGN